MHSAPKGYGQFCPLAKAAEIVTERWTPLVLRELMLGSTRFGQLRRGLPLMSPTLLSRRLKTLETAGILERRTGRGRSTSYHLTPAGDELRPMIELLTVWGNRWCQARFTAGDHDPALFMWFLQRNIDPTSAPAGRSVVRFDFRNVTWGRRRWWIVLEHGCVDVCVQDPGFDVDLFVTADLPALAQVYLGNVSLDSAIRASQVSVDGDARCARVFRRWFSRSSLPSLGAQWHADVLEVAKTRAKGA